MSRPVEIENMKNTSVSAPMDDLNRAKAMGINISDVFRRALSEALSNPEERTRNEKFKGVPKKLLRKAEKFVGEDPDVANVWAGIINTKCGTDLNTHDIMEYVCRV